MTKTNEELSDGGIAIMANVAESLNGQDELYNCFLMAFMHGRVAFYKRNRLRGGVKRAAMAVAIYVMKTPNVTWSDEGRDSATVCELCKKYAAWLKIQGEDGDGI